ncbi:MAG: TIGR00725 family protein [bacterium]
MRNQMIGVIGGGKCPAEIENIAEEVGSLIAQKGGILICGGLSGVMEAASRGAKRSKGTTIGVLPGNLKNDANPYIDIPIVTGLADARNIIIVRSSDAVIAINGEYGTLSEISFCLAYKVPVIGLKTWNVDPAIIQASNANDAVNKAFDLASN